MAKRELYDFAILGGCITSITLGLILQKAGYKVVIIEQQNIGIETSGRYYTVLSERPELVEINDFVPPSGQKSKTVNEYLQQGLKLILSLVKEYNINCDLRVVNGKAISNNGRSEQDHVYLFNPLKYIASLAKVLAENGAMIHESTRVLKIEEEGDNNMLFTNRGKVAAKKIIFTPRSSRVLTLRESGFIPYKTYSLMARLGASHTETVFKSPSQQIITHIVNADKNNTLVEVQGADYKVIKGKNDAAQFKILEDFLYKNFKVDYLMVRWATVYYKTPDDKLLVGPLPNSRHYIVAGYNYSDPSVGTMAALYFTEKLAERNNVIAGIPQAGQIEDSNA